ncbi:MAG: hypothetical protein ETSY1_40810 [Candidatus Entotheonella factor]|uniref:Uncharacterized protein n=1 Tax=Entotheonella factor TaxID=1429438 RepID=W4L6U5_ENTF1|nr:MAG: hypothetical protein ETSY1_40810 [Candidatus Entotheonella factor]
MLYEYEGGKSELVLASRAVEVEGERLRKATATLHANEPGIADFDRILVAVFSGEAIANQSQIRLDSLTRITSILIHSSRERVRGLGTVRDAVRTDVEAPAGVYSPIRKQNVLGLGPLYLEPGDTVELSILVNVLGLSVYTPGTVSIAVPFQPVQPRLLGRVQETGAELHSYLASPIFTIPAGQTAPVTITLEAEGVVDLGHIQLLGAAQSPVANFDQDLLAASVVHSLRLPGADNLIIGNLEIGDLDSLPVVPATCFGHVERATPWIRFGLLEVAQGQQISMVVRNGSPVDGIYSMGMPFYPHADRGRLADKVRPSDYTMMTDPSETALPSAGESGNDTGVLDAAARNMANETQGIMRELV